MSASGAESGSRLLDASPALLAAARQVPAASRAEGGVRLGAWTALRTCGPLGPIGADHRFQLVVCWRSAGRRRGTAHVGQRLTALLGCQTFLIIAGVTGLLPLTGITLPFVAYGNTSLVADFFLLGVLRGISSPAARRS